MAHVQYLRGCLWLALLAGFSVPAWGFNTATHQEILDDANQGVWGSYQNSALKDANAMIDLGCRRPLVDMACAMEWHADNDTIAFNQPNALDTIDNAWSWSALARPTRIKVAVKMAIDDLWTKVQIKKIDYCKTPRPGCLPVDKLDGEDWMVRKYVGMRSHITHDFYSHSTYPESKGCPASLEAFTKYPSVKMDPSLSQLKNASPLDDTIRSGWWFPESVNNRVPPVTRKGSFTLPDGRQIRVGDDSNLPYKVSLPGALPGNRLLYFHDGSPVETVSGKKGDVQGMNKDKDWSSQFPPNPGMGGGFCNNPADGYLSAKAGAKDTQREENRRLCNTIKWELRGTGNMADVMAVWYYITGTELCGCKPKKPELVYWRK